jgi:hypothetical protein
LLFARCENFVGDGKPRKPLLLAPRPPVAHIVGAITPFEVVGVIVGWIPVDVVYLGEEQRHGIGNERLRDNAVNKRTFGTMTANFPRNAFVALWICPLLQLMPPIGEHPAIIRDDVSVYLLCFHDATYIPFFAFLLLKFRLIE